MKRIVLLSIFLFGIANAGFLEEATEGSDILKSPDYQQVLKIADELAKNLCADPKLNSEDASKKKNTEAAAVCTECLNNENTENKISPQINVFSELKDGLDDTNNEKIKKEITFLKSKNNYGFNTDTVESLKNQIKSYNEYKKSVTDKLAETTKQVDLLKKIKNISNDEALNIKKDELNSWLNNKALEIEMKLKDQRYSLAYYKTKQTQYYANQVIDSEATIKNYENENILFKKINSTDLLNNENKFEDDELNLIKKYANSDLEKMENRINSYQFDIKNYDVTIMGYAKKLEALEALAKMDESKSDTSKLKKELAILEAQYSSPALCGMSVAENQAIRRYTGSGYGELNRALRQNKELDKDTTAFVEIMNSGLKKLRPYEGIVRRGVDLPPEVLEQHKVGEIITYAAFTSTSIGSGFGNSHKFIIQSKTGRYVDPISATQGENEVIFLPNTKFRILSKKVVNSYGAVFVMEEVP